MKIFVTGGTGVIGRRLVPILRRGGHDITAVGRSRAKWQELERQGAVPVDVDLYDFNAIAHAITGHDAVINLATHIPHSSTAMLLPWSWRENDRLRQHASAAIVDACLAAGVGRFVQESFAPVYPDCGDRWIDEATAISPVRYNRTVASAELAAERFARSGHTGIVLRFGSFYGSDAVQTRDLIAWVKKGRAPLPGSAGAYISSVSHDDAATALAAAIDLPSGTYNVVDDEPVTHRVFVDSLADALGIDRPKLPPPWVARLLGSVGEMLSRSQRISNAKLRRATHWVPAHPNVRLGWPAVLSELGETPRLPDSRAADYAEYADQRSRAADYAEYADQRSRAADYAEYADQRSRAADYAEHADQRSRAAAYAEHADQRSRAAAYAEHADQRSTRDVTTGHGIRGVRSR